MIGRTLSHYRILEKLGAGGMGEVYRAHDEKLGRDVAVKVLPAGLLSHEEARARFRKEALALSRLSHPHIATLLDFDSQDGIDFLVMELVEGKTLLEAVREGPLSEKEVVRLGSQLARGLAVAHEHGVIHRDLKPGNLALTPDGLLKILDFGLARLERLVEPAAGEKTASTDTAVGHVVGTPAYMAPEQLRGKGVDARTDIYGAGACLYELATGRRPFGSKSGVELSDAVLHEAPASPRSVSGTVSPGLEAVILKALDKDPELRYQTAKELLVDLERLQQRRGEAVSGAVTGPTGLAARPRGSGRWLVAGALAVLVLAAAAWLLRPPPPPRVTSVQPITRGLGVGLQPLAGRVSWATDGTRVYYLAMKQGQAALFQVPAGGGEPVEIPLPFSMLRRIFGFLPRESALLMCGSDGVDETGSVRGEVDLWIVPVPGTSRRVGLRAGAAAVSPDGQRLAVFRGTSLCLTRLDGSELRELLSVPHETFWVRWSPDGRRLRFDSDGPDGRERWIWEVPVEGGRPRPLWPGRMGDWTRDGRYYVFHRRDPSLGRSDLWVAREPGRLPWRRPAPTRLTFGPTSFAVAGPSLDGRRLFAYGEIQSGELLRYGTKGGRFESVLGGVSALYADVSRDGEWLAWVSYPEGTLWRARADGSERRQLTSPPLTAYLPRWSPDGRAIVFAGALAGERRVSLRLVTSEGGEARVLARPEREDGTFWDPCWLPDGRSVVFSHLFDTEPAGLFRCDVGTGKVEGLPGGEDLRYPKCARQGHLLVMTRDPTTKYFDSFAVFRPDRQVLEPLGKLPLSYPNWTRDGRSLCGLNSAAGRIDCYSLATGQLTPLADLRGMPQVTAMVMPWMGLDATDAPLVTRDVSTRDIYALDWEAP